MGCGSLVERDEDEQRDRERFGGPVTDAMLHTALRSCAKSGGDNPRYHYDLEQLARIVNSWLSPVSD